MRIGAKQMTLAVFRQLPKSAIVCQETGNLCGVPWGLVNYNPGDCWMNRSWGHVHVIWQQGKALFRDCVYDDLYPQVLQDMIEMARKQLMKVVGRKTYAYDSEVFPIVKESQKYQDLLAWHRARYQELAALDQLFIAV